MKFAVWDRRWEGFWTMSYPSWTEVKTFGSIEDAKKYIRGLGWTDEQAAENLEIKPV